MAPSTRFDREFWKAFRREGLLKYTSAERAVQIKDRGGETLGGMSFKRRPDWKGWPVVRELQAKGVFEAVLGLPDSVEAKLLVQLLKDDYQAHYWDRLNLEQVPDPLAGVCLDVALNQGPGVLARILQRQLNAFNRGGSDYADQVVDGDLGPASHAALQAFLKVRGQRGAFVLGVAILSSRGTHYLELVERDPEQEANYYGWCDGRVASFFTLQN